jgi:hypothetical protein
MNEVFVMVVSYLIHKDEASLILSGAQSIAVTPIARQIQADCLSAHASDTDPAESLCYKHLARKDDGQLYIEPVVQLLAKAFLTTDARWRVGDLLILRSPLLYLLVENHKRIPDTWRVTPYQNKDSLLKTLREKRIDTIKMPEAL